MRNCSRFILLHCFWLLFFICLASPVQATDQCTEFCHFGSGKVVVANRAEGSISIISTATDHVISTVKLTNGDIISEPMYVVYTWAGHRVFVGDRANNRVVVFDASDFSQEDTIPAGNGVFHMSADPQNQQLWVTNDIDNTATVINPWTLDVIKTVQMPDALVTSGHKPHDVVLDLRHAYVTMTTGSSDINDYVVKFKRKTFKEVARQDVGANSHVALTLRDRKLFVPSQFQNKVFVLNRRKLNVIDEIPVLGAHGSGMTRNGRVFYTTNLPGGGIEGLFTISTKTNGVIGNGVDTPSLQHPIPNPHNITLTPGGRKIYVTHSGADANEVTVYRTTKGNPVPSSEHTRTVKVGANPFGLAYVP